MKSPFLTKMQKKKCDVKYVNINLGQFKDHLISFLIAARMVDGEIVDIEFGPPGKGVVGVEIYTKRKDVEDQVDKKKSGKSK